MTQELINELQVLLDAGTQGEWFLDYDDNAFNGVDEQVLDGQGGLIASRLYTCDAKLIVALHNSALVLLGAARENLRLREALEECDRIFAFFRDVRGGDGSLKPAVEAVNKALGKETV